jgi:hypothetical protein
MELTLEELVAAFARGVEASDRRGIQAANRRSGLLYQPGIGPHAEDDTVRLVMLEVAASLGLGPDGYTLGARYPSMPRQRCDLCIGVDPIWAWAIEVKMLRLLGDNGNLNDNMLMHILSPYPQHRSALTDCEKLLASGFLGRKAVLIYGYNAEGWPLDSAVVAFEALAGSRVMLGPRNTKAFGGLRHPIHRDGAVYGWEIRSRELEALVSRAD